MWEIINTLSFIHVLFEISYDLGTQNINLYINTRDAGFDYYEMSKTFIILDILDVFIREKRISEKEVLKRIPETAMHYLKTLFLLDFISSIFVILTIVL